MGKVEGMTKYVCVSDSVYCCVLIFLWDVLIYTLLFELFNEYILFL